MGGSKEYTEGFSDKFETLWSENFGVGGLADGSILTFPRVNMTSLLLMKDTSTLNLVVQLLPNMNMSYSHGFKEAPTGELLVQGSKILDGRCNIPLIPLKMDDDESSYTKQDTIVRDNFQNFRFKDETKKEIVCPLFKSDPDVKEIPQIFGEVIDFTLSFSIPDDLSINCQFPTIDRFTFVSV